LITVTGLDDFPTAGDAIELADGRAALVCTHLPTPGTSEIAYSAAYVVTQTSPTTASAAKVGQSEPLGKDIACWITMRGTKLRMWVTEPPPGGSGSASHLDIYEVDVGVGAVGGGASNGLDQALRTYLAGAPK
jgi:hypothetical protein